MAPLILYLFNKLNKRTKKTYINVYILSLPVYRWDTLKPGILLPDAKNSGGSTTCSIIGSRLQFNPTSKLRLSTM